MSSVRESYPECSLGSVISPGEYWLVSKYKPHVKEVRDLEDELSNEMNMVSTTPTPDSFRCNACVAVRNLIDRYVWQRGRLVTGGQREAYNVFLVDYGYCVEVNREDIVIITNEKFTQVEPLSFKFCLYGLVPMKLCSPVSDSLEKKSESWTQEAQKYVSDLLSRKLKIVIQKFSMELRTIHGDMYICDGPDEKRSLRELLCSKGFALFEKSTHTGKMVDNPSSRDCESEANESICEDMSQLIPAMKTERIRKWLRENSPCEVSDPQDSLQPWKPAYSEPKDDNNKRDLSPTPSSKCNSKTPYEDNINLKSKSSRNDSNEIMEKLSTSIRQNESESMITEWDSEFQVLASFKDSFIEPVNTFKDADIFPGLVQWTNFKLVTPIQRWGIPAILKGHNVVMIGSSNGKTLAYVLPMLEVVRESLRESQPGSGPISIVICPYLESCKRSLRVITNLLDSKIRIILSHSTLYGSNMVQLTNGCEILLTTPHHLAHFLEYPLITNLERLKFLVLDDIDIMTREPYFSQLRIILSQTKSLKECQTVVCGRKWTRDVELTCQHLTRSSAFIMQSLLEAALYKKLKQEVLFVDHDRKSQVLLDIIRDKVGTRKILIACNDLSEISFLHGLLRTSGFGQWASIIAVSDEMEDGPKSEENPILICSDKALVRSIHVYDVDLLVHYTLPLTKSDFDTRFSTIMANYQNRSPSNIKELKSPEVIILVDNMNSIQLTAIVEIIKRSGGKVPVEVDEMSRKIFERKEMGKTRSLCKSLMKFGECNKTDTCNDRHVLVTDERTAKIPFVGCVKFNVLSAHDVTHLTIRLIAYSENGSPWVEIHDLTQTICEELEMHNKRSEWKSLTVANFRSLCVFQMPRPKLRADQFVRGKIVGVWGTHCDVLAIDYGAVCRLSISDLYEIPCTLSDLRRFPPQSIEVYLCNLMPGDHGSSWPDEVVKEAKAFFESIRDDQFFIGKIMLSFDSTLYLDHVNLCHVLEKLKGVVVDATYRSWLLRDGLITVKNPEHVDKLKRLCELEDTYVSPCESKEERSREPDWEVLDGQFIPVELNEVENVSKLYLRLSQNTEKLSMLEEKCRLECERIMSNRRGSEMRSDREMDLSIGTYCLALHNGVWKRARVELKENERCRVFFIDHGNCSNTTDPIPISDSLLMELPAQAIECCLLGVKSNDSSSVVKQIHEFSDSTILHAEVVERELDGKAAGRQRYKVNLYNSKGLSLSRHLVSSGCVEVDETTRGFISDVTDPLELMKLKANVQGNEYSDKDEDDGGEDEGQKETLMSDTDQESVNDANDPLYFVKMADDVFDNENSVLLLKEFIKSVFPSALTNDNRIEPDATHPGSNGSGIVEADEVPTTDSSTVRQTSAGLSDNVKTTNQTPKVVRYTPTVFWSQDHSNIKLKIDLSNVVDYRLDCSTSYILFRCKLSDKLYVVSLKLFGAVNPNLTKVHIKTFHVQVILTKLCPNKWPRLQRDETKYRWIKYDADEVEEDGDKQFLKNICQRALAKLEASDETKPLQKVSPFDISNVPFTDESEVCTEESDDESDVEAVL